MTLIPYTSIFILFVLLVVFLVPIHPNKSLLSYAVSIEGPTVKDPNLKVEVVAEGLDSPTTMSFLGPNDILVLEKDNGTVRHIVNGTILPEPMLDVNVATDNERGMLGIAVAKNQSKVNNSTQVFLYYTESTEDGNDDCPKPSYCEEWNRPLGNNLYRYELIDNKLLNPKLLLSLPASPGSAHNGGAILIGPDNNLYVPVGEGSFPKTLASNVKDGLSVDGRGGILRISQDGLPILNDTVIGNSYPLSLYYGYGIRNSFGIDFDPVTKKLWDTENGPGNGDEINLVDRGFNSGWKSVQGIWKAKGYFGGEILLEAPTDLVDFDKKGKFSFPEFTWSRAVGVTAVKFLDSDKLGEGYENDLFVAMLIPNGDIYRFDLNGDRSGLLLDKPLDDGVANSHDEVRGVVFGKDFGGITDLEVGPDGYLYVVSYAQGKIFRIVPNNIPA